MGWFWGPLTAKKGWPRPQHRRAWVLSPRVVPMCVRCRPVCPSALVLGDDEHKGEWLSPIITHARTHMRARTPTPTPTHIAGQCVDPPEIIAEAVRGWLGLEGLTALATMVSAVDVTVALHVNNRAPSV
jgi:hypothetical protein